MVLAISDITAHPDLQINPASLTEMAPSSGFVSSFTTLFNDETTSFTSFTDHICELESSIS